MTVTFDPIWPWSQLVSGEGGGSIIDGLFTRVVSWLLVVGPLALVALSAWTYFGSGQPRRRVLAVLGLRLLAFLLVAAAVLRPSLGFADKNAPRSVLYVGLDASLSMTIEDESDSRSRWALLQKLMKESAPAFQKLHDEQNVDLEFYRFAEDVAAAPPDDLGRADGKRTDIGGMLHALYDRRDRRRPLAVLVLSDGADNGTRYTALEEAKLWRKPPASCPVHTFVFGTTSASDRTRDVALTSLAVTSEPVYVKGLLKVKAVVNAPGFENQPVRVQLLIDGKEVKAERTTLPKTQGNEVELEANAPDRPGEIKVTVRVGDPNPARRDQPLEGEANPTNNESSTFVTVLKEGLSVLYVDKLRDGEPRAISDALRRDPRIRLTDVTLSGDDVADADTRALLDCEKNPYDVIILGDVTAKQLHQANPQAMPSMNKAVNNGAGFVMIGGYSSFGNGDWNKEEGKPIAQLVPVDLEARGQYKSDVRMTPTRAGLDRFRFIMHLTDKADEQQKVWDSLQPLEGMTLLGKPMAGFGETLATAKVGDKDEPILVAGIHNKGRVLAFGGDTTHRWIRGPETYAMQRRFWQHMALWLAKQDEAEGSVWVVPATRRLRVRDTLPFRAGMKSKTGVPITDGTYKVEVVAPDGTRTPVATARNSAGEQEGTFTKTDVAGEYRVVVTGKGKDENGEEVQGEASSRFLVYDEDVEMLAPAADHDFMRKLADAGGGKFHQADELPAFLRELQVQSDAGWRARLILWPNWKAEGKLPPFLAFYFALFVAVVGAEWFLRRYWGMV
jgi:hypothetical protein